MIDIEIFFSSHPGKIDSYLTANYIYVVHEKPSRVVVQQCSGYKLVMTFHLIHTMRLVHQNLLIVFCLRITQKICKNSKINLQVYILKWGGSKKVSCMFWPDLQPYFVYPLYFIFLGLTTRILRTQDKCFCDLTLQ